MPPPVRGRPLPRGGGGDLAGGPAGGPGVGRASPGAGHSFHDASSRSVAGEPPAGPQRPARDHDIFEEADSDVTVLSMTMADGTTTVKAATLPKLVQRATIETNPDLSLLDSFLLTYRSFTTPTELLKLLIARYKTPAPAGLSMAEIDEYVNRKQKPIRARVMNALKHWIKTYYMDFLEDPEVVEKTIQFAQTTLTTSGMEPFANQLIRLIEEAKGAAQTGSKLSLASFGVSMPPSILPPSISSITLTMVDPEELARQLTLIEYALYHAIKPWEFLGLAWSKNREKAPNIIALINWSNHAGALVWTTILQSADAKERAQTLRHWIRTADHCRSMKNFNAVMEILSALGNACVNRLKQTFTLLPSKEAKVLEELRALMSPNQNSKAIRDHMVVVDPPCIPYLGLFLTDLTFIEDGNNDFLTDHQLINFEKRRKVSQVIMQVRQFQQLTYFYSSVPMIQEFIKKAIVLESEAAYEMSLLREPKQKAAASRDRAESSVPKQSSSFSSSPFASSPFSSSASKHLPDPLEAEWGKMQPFDPLEYPFNFADTSQLIVTASSGAIKTATLPKLIEKLTQTSGVDSALMTAVVMFQPYLCPPSNFFDLLSKRFNIPLPMNGAKIADFKAKHVEPVRFRIFNLLKVWSTRNFFQFYTSPVLVDDLARFMDAKASAVDQQGLASIGEQVKSSLQKRLESMSQVKESLHVFPSFLGSTTKILLDIDPQAAATFLTIADRQYYEAIDESEWVNFSCHSTPTPELYLHVVQWRQFQASVRLWVGSELIRHLDFNDRVSTLMQLYKIIDVCFELNSLTSAFTIAMAIRDVSKTGILKLLAASIPKAVSASYDKTVPLCSDASKTNKLINAIVMAEKPIVPPLDQFVDTLLSSLGSSVTLDNGHINVKMLLEAIEHIRLFNRSQRTTFVLSQPFDGFVEYLGSVPSRTWSEIEDSCRALSQLRIDKSVATLSLSTPSAPMSSSFNPSISATSAPAPSSPFTGSESPNDPVTPTSSSGSLTPGLSGSDDGSLPPQGLPRLQPRPSSARNTAVENMQLTDDSIKAQFLKVLKSDRAFATELRKQLHQGVYVQETLSDLQRTMRQCLAVIGSYADMTPFAELCHARRELVTSRFPHHSVTEKLLSDPSGAILGWPSQFQFFFLQPTVVGGRSALATVWSHFSQDEFSVLHRALKLLHQDPELPDLHDSFLLAVSVTAEVMSLLSTHNMTLISLLPD